MKIIPVIFEEREIRRAYDESTETWFFSVIDIIKVLTQQPDYQASRKYWKVLKGRLAKEGSELVTSCYQLKMAASDGKLRLTDCATAETLLRLVQSMPSPMAEPIKLWLALSPKGAFHVSPGRHLGRSSHLSPKGASHASPGQRPGNATHI